MSFPWQTVKEDLRWWKRNLRTAKNPIREFAFEKNIFVCVKIGLGSFV